MALTQLILPDKVSFSNNPIVLKLHTDNSLADFISIKVYVSKIDGSGIIMSEFQLKPDVNGDVLYELEALLESALDNDLSSEPTLDDTTASTKNQQIAKYWILAEEIEVYTPNGQTFSISEYLANIVITGGLSHESFPNLPFFAVYTDDASTLHPWLSWKPDYMDRFIRHQDFLYFFSKRETGIFSTLKVEITYTDGTTLTIFKNENYFLQPYEMYCYPIGYGQLELATYDTPAVAKTIQFYTLQLFVEGSSDTISDSRIIPVSRKFFRNQKQFIFLNSLGGYDSAIFYGDLASESERTSVIITKRLPPTYGMRTPQRDVKKNKEQLSFKANSGYISKGHLNWLRELALSPLVYVVESNYENQEYMLPVEITSTKISLDNNSTNLNSFNFEYQYLFANRNFTPFLIVD